MKPVIGVLPLWDDDKQSIWMLPEYFEGCIVHKAIPDMLPFMEEIDSFLEKCDGFLFTGGHDIDPEYYQEKPLMNVECCPKRDKLEKIVLDNALKTDKPVLGICRGIQWINVYFNGTLYQDLPSQYNSGVNHRQIKPYDNKVHKVSIDKQSPFYSLIQKEELYVNSLHHQAIKTLGKGLKAMAYSEDNLIEAIYHPDYSFVWAVQWHPEFLFKKEEDQNLIFKEFIKKCSSII